MSPTPQMFSWTNTSNQNNQFNSPKQSTNGQQSFGFNSKESNNNSYVVNPQNNNSNTLPKFQDAFDYKNSWSNSSSRRGSFENNGSSIFGGNQRKVDWDGEVEKVFIEEIEKFGNDLKSQNRQS